MKRMNLLPPEVRPRAGARHGSSYVVVGALTAAVVGLLVYGIVISGVRSDETELASLKEETANAQALADSLAPYSDFAAMKQQREQSIRAVADTRFNYERLTRELTRILPSGVWVSHLEVTPAEPDQAAVAAGADSTAGSEALPPAMTVSGCAPSQDVVADALDRMRALTGATNVELGSSSNSGVSGSSGGEKPYLVSGAGANGGCGTAGRPRVSFDATVTLTAPGGESAGTPEPTTTTTTTAATAGSAG